MQNPTSESDQPANVAHWTREGFVGDSTNIIRPHHTPDYLSVDGLHVPHRLQLGALPLPDRDDPEALPLPFLVGRSGLQLSASAREAAMPYVVCNVEADEIHFVQQGALAYDTDHGTIAGTAGDFVCIPRAMQYRVRPVETPTLSVVLEIPGAVSWRAAGVDTRRRRAAGPRPAHGARWPDHRGREGPRRHHPLRQAARPAGRGQPAGWERPRLEAQLPAQPGGPRRAADPFGGRRGPGSAAVQPRARGPRGGARRSTKRRLR